MSNTITKYFDFFTDMKFSYLYITSKEFFQVLFGSDGKASACNMGDPGLIPGLGRSPGEGNGNPLQYSCLENPRDGGAWQATVHGVAKSWTQQPLHFISLHFIHTFSLPCEHFLIECKFQEILERSIKLFLNCKQ